MTGLAVAPELPIEEPFFLRCSATHDEPVRRGAPQRVGRRCPAGRPAPAEVSATMTYWAAQRLVPRRRRRSSRCSRSCGSIDVVRAHRDPPACRRGTWLLATVAGRRPPAHDRRVRQRHDRHRARRLRPGDHLPASSSASRRSRTSPTPLAARCPAAVAVGARCGQPKRRSSPAAGGRRIRRAAGGPGMDATRPARALRPDRSLDQHRVPVRRGVPASTRETRPRPSGHRHAVLPHPLQPRDVRHQRRLRLRVRPARTRARAASRARCSHRRIHRSTILRGRS